MNARSFKCESCGAVLPYSEDKKTVCAYCGTTTIYEKKETPKNNKTTQTTKESPKINIFLAIILFLISPVVGIIYIFFVYAKNIEEKTNKTDKKNKSDDNIGVGVDLDIDLDIDFD